MKAYSLFINSQNARNQPTSSTAEDTYIIDWDNIFKNEPATHFTVSFKMVSALLASGTNDNDILLSVNFPSNHHFSQSGSPSSIIGTIRLQEYVAFDKYRSENTENFEITIRKPTDNTLRIKFMNMDESNVTTFTDYVICFKFTPV